MFITVYDWMWDMDLSPTEERLYAFLYGLNQRNQPWRGTQSALATALRIDMSTLWRASKMLQSKHLLDGKYKTINPIADCKGNIADCKENIADCKENIADCKESIADCKENIANCKGSIAENIANCNLLPPTPPIINNIKEIAMQEINKEGSSLQDNHFYSNRSARGSYDNRSARTASSARTISSYIPAATSAVRAVDNYPQRPHLGWEDPEFEEFWTIFNEGKENATRRCSCKDRWDRYLSPAKKKAILREVRSFAPGQPRPSKGNPIFYLDDFPEPQPEFLDGNQMDACLRDGVPLVQVHYHNRFLICTRETAEDFKLDITRDWK